MRGVGAGKGFQPTSMGAASRAARRPASLSLASMRNVSTRSRRGDGGNVWHGGMKRVTHLEVRGVKCGTWKLQSSCESGPALVSSDYVVDFYREATAPRSRSIMSLQLSRVAAHEVRLSTRLGEYFAPNSQEESRSQLTPALERKILVCRINSSIPPSGET